MPEGAPVWVQPGQSTGKAAKQRRAQGEHWAALLERFYLRNGLPPLKLRSVKASVVPAPYHGLLVHSSDMTPTLERFYAEPIGLAVLRRDQESTDYFREVCLYGEGSGRHVEYGVIRVCLDHLPDPVRKRVLAEHTPFGNILHTEAVPHISWPQSYFKCFADAHVAEVLKLKAAQWLYGRRNVLLDASRRLLAEVIEILAPVRGANDLTQKQNYA